MLLVQSRQTGARTPPTVVIHIYINFKIPPDGYWDLNAILEGQICGFLVK